MRTMWMLLFTILPLLAIAYISWHIWQLLPFPGWTKALLILVGLGCFGLLFVNFGRRLDTWPLPLAQVGYEIGTSSLFVLLYLFMLFLVLDLGRLLHIVPRTWLHANGLSAGIVTIVIFGLFLYGNLHYRHKERVSLSLKSAKPLSRTYRIVMVSDLHLGYHNPRTELARWIDLINAEHPDLVLIAGDIIDGSVRPLQEEHSSEEFRRLQAPIYACLGNHEYYSGEPGARQFYEEAGIHLLSDSSVEIDNNLVLIGRDDRTNLHRLSVQQLVNQVDSNKYIILLDHQPYHLERSERAGVNLQLSGHTHRGQVWPISWITDAIYECSWGPYQRGATQYYVSSGIGIWGGKYRIGTQSEYVVISLSN